MSGINLFYLLDDRGAINAICDGKNDLGPVFGILGYVIIGIKIVVPILLIFAGMFQMTKAVMNGDDKKVKDATTGLVWKIVAAVCVFLVLTLVTFLMSIIGSDSWKKCYAKCINSPTKAGCRISDRDV